MARLTQFGTTSTVSDEVIAARTITGTIAADVGTLTDANFPPANAINCTPFDSVFVGVEITGGTAPTASVELLFRDAEAADGSRWFRVLPRTNDSVTPPLSSNTNFSELSVYGATAVYPRVVGVTSATSTTAMKILMMPGRTRNISRTR